MGLIETTGELQETFIPDEDSQDRPIKKRLSRDRPIRQFGKENRLKKPGQRSPAPLVEPLPKKPKTTADERQSRSVTRNTQAQNQRIIQQLFQETERKHIQETNL